MSIFGICFILYFLHVIIMYVKNFLAYHLPNPIQIKYSIILDIIFNQKDDIVVCSH